MNNKYYTPELSDLYVDYECEIFRAGEYSSGWEPIVWGEDDFEINRCNHKRTPYLTREQIEAEGWREIHSDEYIIQGELHQYWFNNNAGTKYLSCIKRQGQYGNDIVFLGKCNSINEFRKLIKWIGI
jgi:hypothetical protein